MMVGKATLAVCGATLALGLTGCGEDSEFTKSFDKSFEEKWRTSYVEQCTKGAVASSAVSRPEELARSICTCSMEYSDTRLTIGEKMDPESEKTRTVATDSIKTYAAQAGPK
jgi:hypothetical protein